MRVLGVVFGRYFLARESGFTGMPTHINGDKCMLCYMHYIILRASKSEALVKRKRVMETESKNVTNFCHVKERLLIKKYKTT